MCAAFVELDWKSLKYGKNEVGNWNFVFVMRKANMSVQMHNVHTFQILHTSHSIAIKEF